jgi:hypothetical protein
MLLIPYDSNKFLFFAVASIGGVQMGTVAIPGLVRLLRIVPPEVHGRCEIQSPTWGTWSQVRVRGRTSRAALSFAGNSCACARICLSPRPPSFSVMAATSGCVTLSSAFFAKLASTVIKGLPYTA